MTSGSGIGRASIFPCFSGIPQVASQPRDLGYEETSVPEPSLTPPRIIPPLLEWYDGAHRDLPFRRTRDPYAIWVSEVMLQQTQVKTVLPYFQRWMERFPSLAALAAADEDQVLHAWQGLGYYSRARSLLKAARAAAERFDGELPRSVDALLSLPGIGPYSAGAIASIAFNQRVPVVDGNVVRVLCRVFELTGDPRRAPLKNELWRRAAELVPQDRPGDFNQAIMELGATICTPRRPKCAECPIRTLCRARASGRAESLPELPEAPAPTEVPMAAALVRQRGRWAVVQLSAHAKRWASMWQFPNVELAPAETLEAGVRRAARELAGIDAEPQQELCVIKHTVTRFRITLTAYSCRFREKRSFDPERVVQVAWKRPSELAALAMPAAHRRLSRVLLGSHESG
jgi:A/G-specific adenine glycosylase